LTLRFQIRNECLIYWLKKIKGSCWAFTKMYVKTQSGSTSLARLAASLLSLWFRGIRSIPMFSDQEALHWDPYITNSADSALTNAYILWEWFKMCKFVYINQ
jgi:hypothetical protein